MKLSERCKDACDLPGALPRCFVICQQLRWEKIDAKSIPGYKNHPPRRMEPVMEWQFA